MNKDEYFFIGVVFLLIVSIVSAELTSDNYIVVTDEVSDGGGEFNSTNYITSVVSEVVSGEAVSDDYVGQLGVLYGLDVSENSAPTILIVSPLDGNTTTDRTPEFVYDGSDVDGDSLVYDINITKEGISLCSDYNLDVQDYVSETYSPSQDLKCLFDNGDYYEWSVRVCENETAELLCSDWTSVRMINITSLVQISLPVDSVEFGNIRINESKNTTSPLLNPFVFQNDGNCKINISMNATKLWSSISDDVSEYFQSKIRDYIGNASWANTSWFQIPTITGFVTVASDLNYSDESDNLVIDLLVRVPDTESLGAKSSTINFQAELSETYGVM